MFTMRKSLLIFSLCLATLLAAAPVWAEKVRKNVLYLNSYHHGYQWSDEILGGVRSVLVESEFKIDLQIEYMDFKKYRYDDVGGMLLRLYEEKFAGEGFDVIMTSDNDAFDFASQYREVLFPGVPIVFSGVNDLREEQLVQGDVTGVVENFDMALTLDVALRLHADKRRMVVVGDESSAGLAIKRQIESVTPQFRDRLDVEYWTNLSLGEVHDRVRTVPRDTFLFFIPYYQTIDGRFFTAEEVMQTIYAHSSVPIYTAWEFLLGHGAVGGRLLSGFNHGQTAADMTLRVLRGERASDIPVFREPTGEYAFDHVVLDKLSVDQTLLPDGSRIINAPKAFYELPKELFWTIIVSFFLLVVVLLFLVLSMDERRKVERKIKDQLAFQETLMNTAPQLVSWKGVDGLYLGANRAFAEFFGFKDGGEIVEKSPTDIMRDADYARWAADVDRAALVEEKEFVKERRSLIDAEGREAWLEVTKAPIRDQSGKVVGVLSTADNITKEQELEKQLLQSQKMEAIGTLAGGIAHDFNNILTSIINSTELAVGDVEQDSVTRKDLERALKAARRGGRVVKQILAFSRPSTEGFRSIDLGGVVAEAINLLEASLPSSIEVRATFEPNLAQVQADPTQMHQVAMNLCTNAFHALRETGGVIEVRMDHAKLGEEHGALLGIEPGEYVRLTVEDNGPGIPPEIADKIFEPFFSTKDKTEGTGLGLAVVHGIIHSHRGGLQAFPREGGGAVFEIYLPMAESESFSDGVDAKRPFSGGAEILFVEDDEDQLVTTPRLLEAMGHRVTAMARPTEAADMVVGVPHRFDLVITDYDMPGMSGADLAAKAAQAAPGLPVIMVSGREDAAPAVADLPNVRRVVIKPYDKDDLSAAIHAVLDRR